MFRWLGTILAFTLFLPAAFAAAQAPAAPDAPDAITEAAPPPARADLSEVNERLRAQDYAGAEELLYTLEESFPDDPAVMFKLGEVLLVLEQTGEALEYLERAAELDPTRDRLFFQLGIAQAGSGKMREAIDSFGKEIENSEEPQVISMAHMNRAMMYRRLIDWPATATELRAFIALRPEESAVYGDLANAQMESGDAAAAEATLDEGQAHGFSSPGHYYALGARHYKDGRYADAERCLLRSLELDPSNADATRSLAATLERLGRDDEAAAQLRRYLELNPSADDREKVLEQLGEAG